MKCENCQFYKRLKHNFKLGEGYTESNCCIALLIMDEVESGESTVEPWVQEVEPDSYCEMFSERKQS